MEFFAEISSRNVTADRIYEFITIEQLPELCASINSVVSTQSPQHGEIYCVWGLFQISREKIRKGIRIALLNCPHALAWTITVHEARNMLVVHCTIDDREADDEFALSIEGFVNDWGTGLSKALSGQP